MTRERPPFGCCLATWGLKDQLAQLQRDKTPTLFDEEGDV